MTKLELHGFKQDFDLDDAIENDDVEGFRKWLKDNDGPDSTAGDLEVLVDMAMVFTKPIKRGKDEAICARQLICAIFAKRAYKCFGELAAYGGLNLHIGQMQKSMKMWVFTNKSSHATPTGGGRSFLDHVGVLNHIDAESWIATSVDGWKNYAKSLLGSYSNKEALRRGVERIFMDSFITRSELLIAFHKAGVLNFEDALGVVDTLTKDHNENHKLSQITVQMIEHHELNKKHANEILKPAIKIAL